MGNRVSTFVRARPDACAITLLLAVSLAIRLRHLCRPLHGDEMITFSNMVLGRDIAGIIFGPYDSNSHLLNSLVMKTVHLGFGEAPALMRLPNLVFVLLAVVLLYVMSAKIIGRFPAFAAALLFSLHPAMVLYSVFARGYAGMVLFTLVSSALFLQALHSFSRRRLMASALAGFLAGAFHLFAINVLVAQALLALALAVRPDTRGPEEGSSAPSSALRTVFGPAIAIALLVAVLLPSMRTGAVGSSTFAFQTEFPVALVNFLGGNAYLTSLDVVSLFFVLLAAVGLFSLKWFRVVQVYLGLLFLAPAVLYVLSYAAPIFNLHPRFFVFLLPAVCFLFAAGLDRLTGVFSPRSDSARLGPSVARGAAVLCVLFVAFVFIDRIEVPKGKGFTRLQRVVGEFVDIHPEARFLTNDTGFVRVRLRQEMNMDRIWSAPGILAIRAALDEEPAHEVYYIHVPRKRFSETDLVHYKGKVAPEVHYERDDRLRGFLERNTTLEVDLAPKVMIYDLRSPPRP